MDDINVPDQARLLAAFDELVAASIIKYAQPTKTTSSDSGFAFEFLVSTGQKNKEQIENNLASTTTNDKALDPVPRVMFGPGSDIVYDARLVITEICGTHHMVFNLYPIVQLSLLLLTKDSYKTQHQALDLEDLTSTYTVLDRLSDGPDNFYAFFNCTWTGGASRRHKHVQVMPQEYKLFPDRDHYEPAGVPFKHFLARLDASSEHLDLSLLFQRYQKLLAKAKAALELTDGETVCPHNVVMTRKWMLVIPRRDSGIRTVPIPNAPGMMGSIWLSSYGRLEAWHDLGPAFVLSSCGVPNEA